MVRIERVVLQGFKSFKKRVTIPMQSGISVFTGPNGSGKSCIADSISFVMGESKSRIMRAKKAQDLIFHGSKKKTGCDSAIVTVYIDNSKKNIPLPSDIVSVTRRINKKGVSTYRLNEKVVTRQQVVDILSEGKMHPNGHNIIQQGEVNQIIEMDAVQRRGMIDEISGIAEYDEKKVKAERELQRIEEKVKEAEIVLNEKVQVMDRLGKERDAAMKYKDMEHLLTGLRTAVILKTKADLEGSMEDVGSKLEEKNKASEKLDEDIKKMDEEITGGEKEMENITTEVMKASERIETTKRITELRAEIDRIKDRIESNSREAERVQNLIERMRGMEGVEGSPAMNYIMKTKGVFGRVTDLVDVPAKYRVAVEVGAGSHLKDIIVDTSATAVKCIKYLKTNKVGRERFLPLDKIQSIGTRFLPANTLGWVSELIGFEPKYKQAMEYIFGTTACVESIDVAKDIMKSHRVRMVSLDGDLVEASGAMTGGYYKSRGSISPEISKYVEDRKNLEKETEEMGDKLVELNAQLEKFAKQEQSTDTFKLDRNRGRVDEKLKKTREKRKEIFEKKIILQQEIGKLNIEKARIEAGLENQKAQMEQMGVETGKKVKDVKDLMEKPLSVLKDMEKDVLARIHGLGPVNLKSLEDFEMLKNEFDEFKQKVDKIVSEKNSVLGTIKKIEERRAETFNRTLGEINKRFKEVYSELTEGEADLVLENPGNIETGLMVKAQPPGKKLLNIDSMSGGEKTLTAFAFLFAIQRYRPSPFYVLDEADATLDKVNTVRVANLIKKQSRYAQFILISHNDNMIRQADQVYGVTMEDGESKVMAVKLPETAGQGNN
jgi:chromosome segregation protein